MWLRIAHSMDSCFFFSRVGRNVWILVQAGRGKGPSMIPSRGGKRLVLRLAPLSHPKSLGCRLARHFLAEMRKLYRYTISPGRKKV